ncbi:MAG: hypothetical protein IPK80_28140 [Nannocystis sp.]|nr:hypothetical protein [Nannocystis sp.]
MSLLPGEIVAPPNNKPRTFVITLDPTLSLRWTRIGYTDPVWLAKASPYFLAHGATGRVAVGGSYGYRLTFDTIARETPNKAPHGWIVALDQ